MAVDGAEFTASVTRGPTPSGHVLRIACRKGCSRPLTLERSVDDVPLSLFRRWDGGPLLYTLWAATSQYRVQVFALSAGRIRRVLDAYSLGRPDFTSGPDGAEAVRIAEGAPKQSGRDLRPVTFTWTGRRFARR